MVNLKFGAFTFALCLLLISCVVCDTTNGVNPCKIQDTTAACESNENFKSLQDATNITKLIVRSNELKRIEKDDLAAFVNLEEIDLSSSGLEEIDENAFAGLTKLHKINLAGNTKLKVPNDGSFIISNTLTCLNLSNTVVEQLDKTFNHLPQLQILDLSGTNVKDFSALEHLEHLTKLVVSKTNENKDLCNIIPLKEIIEKDENRIETPLDCKTGKEDEGKGQTTKPNIEEPLTIAKKPEDEGKQQTTKPNIEETSTTAKKPEDEATTVATKKEPTKAPEATTVAPEVPQAAEKNKTDNEPNKEPKSSDTEITTVVASTTKGVKPEQPVPVNIHGSSEKEATTVAAVTKENKHEHPDKNTEEKATTEANKTEENEPVPKPVNTEKVNETEVIEHSKVNKEDADTKQEKKVKTKDAELKMKDVPNENPQFKLNDSDDGTLPSTTNTSQSNGVNIVLGIILCVMIVGAIGFGYKYWKNRRSGYTHANTQDNDDEDKELQTIVAHRADPE